MNDDSSHRPSLIDRLTSWLLREPEDREQLLEVLHSAYDHNLLDADALTMIEGVHHASRAMMAALKALQGQR